MNKLLFSLDLKQMFGEKKRCCFWRARESMSPPDIWNLKFNDKIEALTKKKNADKNRTCAFPFYGSFPRYQEEK